MEKTDHRKLGQAASTAICGNDILSSALYVAGIAILFAGALAPFVLLFIGIVLLLYKLVYTEVVEALPVNGGAYNCLLNSSSKTIAALAAVMTLLSYVATAVISAKVGVEYLGIGVHNAALLLLKHDVGFPIIPVTVVVLFVFALLVIAGVKDSAKVALSIFVIHVLVLTLFLALGARYAFTGHSYFDANFIKTISVANGNGGFMRTLFLAFSASLLGVSGFESSANFVEEQRRGVFRKTLRNMLIGVTIFNPLIALAVLHALPYARIVGAQDFLLANVATVIGGQWFQYLLVVDAFLVLCGAVLTAYVGVSGLVQRMTADGCLPSFFFAKTTRGSFPRIVLGFFLLCGSILLLTHGDLLSLAGVYTIAFLGVMSLFALGNLILKESRPDLKRTYRAPGILVFLALLATAAGIVGNIMINPQNLLFFALYFVPAAVVVLCMIYEDYILRFALRLPRPLWPVHGFPRRRLSPLPPGRFVVFINNVSRLQPILDYIHKNEVGLHITLLHCSPQPESANAKYQDIRRVVPELQRAGFYPQFHLSTVYKQAEFSPATINEVAREQHMKKNRIFIGSIHHSHPFEYDELGGVRIIF